MGKSVTANTTRNWLLGKSIPMQDKLRVLAEWLHVCADELRFGSLAPVLKSQEAGVDRSQLTMQDRDAGALHDAVVGRPQDRR